MGNLDDDEFTIVDGGMALIDATIDAVGDPVVITFRLLDSPAQIQVQIPRMLPATDAALMRLMVNELPELLSRVLDPETTGSPFGIIALREEPT